MSKRDRDYDDGLRDGLWTGAAVMAVILAVRIAAGRQPAVPRKERTCSSARLSARCSALRLTSTPAQTTGNLQSHSGKPSVLDSAGGFCYARTRG